MGAAPPAVVFLSSTRPQNACTECAGFADVTKHDDTYATASESVTSQLEHPGDTQSIREGDEETRVPVYFVRYVHCRHEQSHKAYT